MYDRPVTLDAIDTRGGPQSARHLADVRCLFGTGAALALICQLAIPASAQIQCTRDGDWLTCENGERYPIRVDPFARMRMRPNPSRQPGANTPDAGRASDAPMQTSDGLQCWPHGDHAHCE